MEYNNPINNGNVEKTVQKGEFLYFVTKDGQDKPLESHRKILLIYCLY